MLRDNRRGKTDGESAEAEAVEVERLP